ncbi:ScyD/ScyE family protein [Glaciihabitans sp. dw_435]|uniref:ScyD/ScyE family protein n=1 Tax=Glaciihabitans sp. dw_435 TaxID=2720081 RepID=UPI001BD306D8|nr:ScyD/ScyE family protein [Glaciihabitans sp. dw_435]
MKLRKLLLSATATTALVATALLVPSAAIAHGGHPGRGHGSHTTVLTTGLQGATGGTIGPDGALYVTEAITGSITRVDTTTGEKTTFTTGLPTRVADIAGAIDVAFVGKAAYALVSVVGPDAGGTAVDGIYRVDDPDSATLVADLGEWSRTHPPATDFFLDRGVQFAFQPVRGGFLVTDGHHNRVLHVTRSGVISELIAFGNTVPTGLDVRNGTVYLAEAGPVPHAPADGKVIAFAAKHPSSARTVAAGYSLLVDVEFGPGGLYALSQGDSPGEVPAGSPALPTSGELLKVTHNGTFSVVASGLNLPTSVDFVRDTAYIVTLGGEVVKVTHVSTR